MNSKSSIYKLIIKKKLTKECSLLEHVALLAGVPLQQHAVRGGRVGQDTEGLPLPVQCPLLVFQNH